MTECIQSSFGFEACGKREIVARFDGGTISSDGGAFLLRQTDQRLNLLPRLAQCFLDGRNQEQVEHSILEMLSQRIYGLALGYEDINDHEQLRADPVFGILAGREELEEPLAGKSTLNRMELGTGTKDRYKKITFWKNWIDELFVTMFLESYQTVPEKIILDVDTTDLPLHGKQEGRFFHGYYDNYCYLPLYIFCGEQILCARLREANHDASFGSLAEIQRIVTQIREAWPKVKITLRGDSGFCRDELMSWCENNGVDFVFGLARNQRLRRIIGAQMNEATQQWRATSQPARVFCEVSLQDQEDQEGRLGPRAARGGESGTYRRERESTVCGDVVDERAMGGAGFVREAVLRAWRHGEPHQRAVQFVRRPGEHRDDAGQPDAAVSVGHGLHLG